MNPRIIPDPTQRHISTVPTFPNGDDKPPVYELDGLCHCHRRNGPAWGECRTCRRLIPADSDHNIRALRTVAAYVAVSP